MISLEQVRQLDIRVKKAVTAVKSLTAENKSLKERIAELESALEKLSTEAEGRLASEQQLEVSLQGVLDVLDEVDSETSEIEPEPPADNYVIETVSIDEEAEDEAAEQPESAETESSPAEEATSEESSSDGQSNESAEEEVSAEEPAIETEPAEDNESEEDVSEDDTVEEDTAEEAATDESGSPVEAEPELKPGGTEAVTEEVPGVGQVVEFTAPPELEPEQEEAAAGDQETPAEPDSSVEPEDQPAEEVKLEKDEVIDDDFQSEFDIF